MNVERYWRNLVNPTSTDSLELVGHPEMGRAFNQQAYRVRLSSLERAISSVGARPDGRIFEAAYGTGFYLSMWRRRGHRRVAGVDVAPGAHVMTAKAFPEFDLRLGDVSALTAWADWNVLVGTFDFVTAIDVIYHLVDDQKAEAAVLNLARLVGRGGYLVVTDKFTGLSKLLRESGTVTRRPLAWYEDIVAREGLRLVRTIPMMLCSDPPAGYGGPLAVRLAARGAWLAARAPLKWLPPNGRLQQNLGRALGSLVAAVDLKVLPHLRSVPNLMIAIFERPEQGQAKG